MNKNRKIKRGLTTSLAVGMSVMMGAVPVFAAGTSSDADAVYKEETVYVNADATGTIDEVTVSNWLKNSGSVSGSLTDASTLKDIKNVKGDETFKESGDTLTWNTDGEDIYYQGTTDQDLPVSVKLTYYLDGKEIKPADLKGKSGHLKIQVDYTNKEKKTVSVDGKQEEVYTPFVMMTGMILPNETFSNVTIDNGKVISDGSKNIVVGFGMPGMKESLNLDESKTEDLTIPESLCVEADVTDFTMSSTFTVALTDLLDDIDFDNIVDVDSLKSSLDELEDAALQLVSGSDTLADGAGTLADGVNSYTEGADTLNDAIQKYLGSNGELNGSVTEYVNGVNKVVKGVQDYTDGTNALADGVTAYIGGEQQLAAGAAKLSQLSSGLKTVQGAISQLNASGGLRATFEARGYTAWDCTSPAFVRQDAGGATLCIPTAFCSYTGEALDQKTPLLRSMEAINKEALRLLRLFGNTTSKKVTPSVGAEQEYFLVDAEKFEERKDLIYTGRTLFGAMPPKGQELDDHYFGTIRQRIASFMRDVNIQLWKVGVPAKTQHNEVAPAQHELAPIYTEANIAVDQNQLTMQTLKRVACQHGLKCLLHEKPFAGVNGSGKHDNWSITTDDGINLLDPGKTPHENTQFLLVLACILKAVNKHADLLRESAADPGNDHRLGANEAPPAIISIFLGEQLEDVVEQLISTGEATHSLKGGKLETGVSTLPDLFKDATDRNRTSPFAFTGNKFEFRMVGSRDSIANPNIVLNTIVAEAFADACDILEKADDFDLAVHDLIKEYLTENQRIIFNGNGYSDEWVAEAERRGLPNIKSMVEAIPAITTDKAVELFERFSVFTKAELESRAEIQYEAYAKAINIEARTMIDMASKQFLPAFIKYTKTLADTVNAVKAAGVDASVQTETLKEVSALMAETKAALDNLVKTTADAAAKEEGEVQATYYHTEVVPAMDALRAPVDKLEMIVDKEAWPMPSYGDLIFEV